MKILLRLLLVLLGLGLVIWGFDLVHSEYTKTLNMLNFVKTGREVSEVGHLHNSGEAFKSVAVHLGLVVFGILVIVAPLAFAKHNK